MISYRVISLLALATASTASPIINAARRALVISCGCAIEFRMLKYDYGLFQAYPHTPPACLAKVNSTALSAPNATSGANTTNLTDTSSFKLKRHW